MRLSTTLSAGGHGQVAQGGHTDQHTLRLSCKCVAQEAVASASSVNTGHSGAMWSALCYHQVLL